MPADGTSGTLSGRRPYLSRRYILGGALVVALAGGAVWRGVIRPPSSGTDLAADEAQKLALSGEINLIDIRTPREWAQTGVGTGAQPLDMRRDDFVNALDTLVNGDRSQPVALICARGVRSALLSNRLEEAGYTNIIDVPEGMLGSSAGPGWLERGLAVTK